MEIKVQRIQLPASAARLQEVLGLILRLPRLQEMRLTLSGIEVKRAVEDEEVVPATIVELAAGVTPAEPEVEFLFKSVRLEALPSDPERHPLHTLIQLMERVRLEQLFPSAWYVTAGDHLDAFLAQPQGTLPVWLFGVPVHYVGEDQLPDGRIVLIGSTTRHSIDATFGVTADIGG